MTVYLTRKEQFSAAHRLWVDDWSEEENWKVFGNCANKYFHGHNYQLFVTVKGTPDSVTGMIVNAKDLGQLMREEVTSVLDHSNLNMDPNFLPDGVQSTTENLVYYIWQLLAPKMVNCELHCVKVIETDKISAEYYGE